MNTNSEILRFFKNQFILSTNIFTIFLRLLYNILINIINICKKYCFQNSGVIQWPINYQVI
jgi:hypothetical protein